LDRAPRERVDVAGNHYFNAATLKELLSVHAADSIDRQAPTPRLWSLDLSALQAVYQNNGFSKVKITPRRVLSEWETERRSRRRGLQATACRQRRRRSRRSRDLPHRGGRTVAGGHGAH